MAKRSRKLSDKCRTKQMLINGYTNTHKCQRKQRQAYKARILDSSYSLALLIDLPLKNKTNFFLVYRIFTKLFLFSFFCNREDIEFLLFCFDFLIYIKNFTIFIKLSINILSSMQQSDLYLYIFIILYVQCIVRVLEEKSPFLHIFKTFSLIYYIFF